MSNKVDTVLTIGRLSRLFGITAKTLRHYESIGLFAPARVDAWSGYRYYAPAQLAELARILELRAVGMPLEAIRALGEVPAAQRGDRLAAALVEHAERLQRELADCSAALDATHRLMHTLSQRSTTMMQATLITLPAFRLIGLELEDGKLESIGPLWGRFSARMDEIAGNEPAVAYGACIGQPGGEFRYLAAIRVAADAPVPEGMCAWTIAAQKYAVFLHRGPYRDMTNTFCRAYAEGLADNGLTPVEGIDLERYEFARCPMPDGPDTEVDLYVPVA